MARSPVVDLIERAGGNGMVVRWWGLLLLFAGLAYADATQAESSSGGAYRLAPAFIHQRSIEFSTPRSGQQKLLVVPVDFPDKQGHFSRSRFLEKFFGAQGSFADYFRQASYGQLDYSGTVISGAVDAQLTDDDPQYVRLPHPESFYAHGSAGRDGSAFPQNSNGLVYDTVVALDNAGFDFSDYADPVTGEISNLLVVFAGAESAETRSVEDLGATAHTLAYHFPGGLRTSQGFIIRNYTLCGDQDASGQFAPAGVCVHEQGHALGLPDLYDIRYNNAGAGLYDFMAYGVYGGVNRERPLLPGAYSKVTLGWVTPREAPEGTTIYRLRAVGRFKDVVKVRPTTAGSDEYFLLENRQPTGFDTGFRGRGNRLCSGLYIWHIDPAVIQTFKLKNLVNSTGPAAPEHPGVSIVEADGDEALLRTSPKNYGECGDAWQPGRVFGDKSQPSSKLWTGVRSGIKIRVLSRKMGVITVAVTRKPLRG